MVDRPDRPTTEGWKDGDGEEDEEKMQCKNCVLPTKFISVYGDNQLYSTLVSSS